MSDAPYAKAPAWRRTGANLLDMALLGGLWWLARSRGWVRDGGRAASLMAAPGDPLREQLRSPGQLALGTRTVDLRTGARVALWRTLAVTAAGAASREITRRLGPARSDQDERERDAFVTEMQAIMARHPQASPEREAEQRALYARHHRDAPSMLRAVAPSLAVGVVMTRLRRRLAPTVEIRARGPHSP